jgi:hypothetical protein
MLYDADGGQEQRRRAMQQQQPQAPQAQPQPQPQAGAAPRPSPLPSGAVQQARTFAQMQAQGMPRPAPTPMPAPPMTGGPNLQGVAGGLASTVGLLGPRPAPASIPGNLTPPGIPPRPAPTPIPGNLTPPDVPPRPTPTPIPAAPGGTGGTSGMGGQLQSMLLQLMANPSSYDSDAMRREYEAGGRGIDDDFAMQQTLLKEEMARRGLSDSSIYGGRMADLNVGRRSAQTELQDRLLQKMADTRAGDLRSALGLGMQFHGDESDRSLRAGELAAGREDRAQQLGLQREMFGYERERDAADRTMRQDELMRQFGLDERRLGVQQDQFNRGYSLDRDRFDYDRQRGDDQLMRDWWESLGGLDLFGLGV